MSGRPESKRPGRLGADGTDQGVAAPPLSGGLWLVATPIGNADDVTLRALEVLAGADVLAAEDTRRTRRLLDMHGIAVGGRPFVSYHDQNGAARRPQILDWLADGRSVAYASDAGTPLIADPGYKLVAAAQEAGHAVHAVPGASSVLAALTVAGLPTDRFLFAGFLPPKSSARRRALLELADVPATLVFFESPHRVADTLGDMSAMLGDRPAALTRELTKKFEEVRRGTLQDLAETLSAEAPPKGEIVLVVGAPGTLPQAQSAEALDTALKAALETQTVKEAARSVAESLGLPKREVYARALELSGR